MQKIDARKLTAKELELLRKQAVRLHKKGKKYGEIAEALGVHRNRVSEWCRAYEEKGAAALKVGKSGRPKGFGRSLTPEQEAAIQKKICDHTPDQLKLAFALWTRRAVQQLIKRMFQLTMPIRTVGEYLDRWGFTPQKPLKQAYEQRPAEVRKWLDEEYPAIKARARTEGAEIHWGDETGLRSDCQHGRSYAPQGKTPVIRLNAKRTSRGHDFRHHQPGDGSIHGLRQDDDGAGADQVHEPVDQRSETQDLPDPRQSAGSS